MLALPPAVPAPCRRPKAAACGVAVAVPAPPTPHPPGLPTVLCCAPFPPLTIAPRAAAAVAMHRSSRLMILPGKLAKSTRMPCSLFSAWNSSSLTCTVWRGGELGDTFSILVAVCDLLEPLVPRDIMQRQASVSTNRASLYGQPNAMLRTIKLTSRECMKNRSASLLMWIRSTCSAQPAPHASVAAEYIHCCSHGRLH
jgi:hypothetical protein